MRRAIRSTLLAGLMVGLATTACTTTTGQFSNTGPFGSTEIAGIHQGQHSSCVLGENDIVALKVASTNPVFVRISVGALVVFEGETQPGNEGWPYHQGGLVEFSVTHGGIAPEACFRVDALDVDDQGPFVFWVDQISDGA